MSSSIPRRPVLALFVMVFAVVVVWLLEEMNPRMIPPGNVWTNIDTLKLLLLLAAAWRAGRWGLRNGIAVLGAVGAVSFFVFLPDRRDMLSIASGRGTLESYLFAYGAFILIMAFACRTSALMGVPIEREPDRTKCPGCGYDIRGLSEQRCPECGSAFDWRPPSAAGDDGDRD